MPRAQQNKVYNTFVKGRITEAGPLTFPENAMTDEENINLFATGSIKRRLGADVEDNFVLSSQDVLLSTWNGYAISSTKWDTVGGDGNLNFLVLQIGDTLYFYDMAIIPLSRGQKSFTVDLNDFKAPDATDVEKTIVQMESGKGLLFVSGSKIESFFVEHDANTDSNPTLLDLSSGTYFGDMTRFGGHAAAFDGNDDQTATDTATGAQNDISTFVGVDFGAGLAKKISEVRTFGANNLGYNNGQGQVGQGSVKIFGSNSLPTDPTNGTLLGDTGLFSNLDSTQEKIFTITDNTAYRYIWAALSWPVFGGLHIHIAEITIFEELAIVTSNPTITSTKIDIDIRDFEGLDDGLANDAEPVALSDEHSYNLKNQGWNSPGGAVADPVTTYFTSQAKYPPNSKQWWVAKDSSDDFNAVTLTKFLTGNTLAPKGHFILEAFSKDRATESSITALTIEKITGRPSTVAFFAGRVWWAGINGDKVNGNIYFNQILEGTSNIGRCYQVNDPTSEDLNTLLATDGGVVVVPEIGSVLKLFAMQTALIIFADNGVWSITGTDSGGFKATDFTVSRIGSVGIEGAESIVDVEGIPVWWGKTGINTLSQNEITDKFGIVNLSKDTIQEFYENIPSLSKVDVKGNYDQITKKIFWLYRSVAQADNVSKYRFDKILILDTRLGAFYSWAISKDLTTPYYIGGSFVSPIINSATENSDVVDGTDNLIDGTDQIIVVDSIIVGTNSFIEFFVFQETSNVKWTFGTFRNTSFKDWVSVDNIGLDYISFFETGDELMQDIQREKQSTYIHVLFNRTELEYADLSYETWIRPSGCTMQSKWEWSDSSSSGKFGPKVQVYRFHRRINDIVLDGSDIVVDGTSQVFAANTYVPSSGVDFDSGFPVTITKNKVRGNGKALRLRFESESGKDFDLLGWAINFSGNTAV